MFCVAEATPTWAKPSARAFSRTSPSSSPTGVGSSEASTPYDTLLRVMTWDRPPLFLQGRMNAAPAIAYRVFLPEADPKMQVVVTFGYFENMKRYREVVERWNARGVAVTVYDLRGHGLSEGRRGFIARFSEYVDDLQALLAELDKDAALRSLGPPVLFGHSLGGLISIHGA